MNLNFRGFRNGRLDKGVRTTIGHPDFSFAKYFLETLLLGCAKAMQSHNTIDEIYTHFFSDVEEDENDAPPGVQHLIELENLKEWNQIFRVESSCWCFTFPIES